MLQLSEIWIYPIKSLGGISLTHAQITDRGLLHDRRWLLIDANNQFLSQREHPQLALFQPEIVANSLQVVCRATGDLVSFSVAQQCMEPAISVTLWDEEMLAYEVSKTVSTWFSNKLNFSVRLVYMPEATHRKVAPEFAVTPYDKTSFSDGFPFLLLGQSSLDDLNRRLKMPVAMNRFRPNFVFTGGKPYEEETWRQFNIAAVSFYGVKPCSRCVMTTVDQEKGVLSGKEPLKTLAKYRQVGNNVIFGQNVIGPNSGSIAVGDALAVINQNG